MCRTLWWKSYQLFLFWRTYVDWWHFSGYDGKHCFLSCPSENSIPTDGEPPHLSHSLAPCFPECDYSEFFLLQGCKIHYWEEVQSMNGLHDRIFRAAECVTKEINSAWVGGKKLNIILMCHATNSAHIEIWAHKKLCEVQCLKMYLMPLIVPILRSEHIGNFVRSSVWKCINFPSTLYGWRYKCFILF